MCELLGVSTNKPVAQTDILKNFFAWGEENPDGFGLGFYRHGRAVIRKQAKPAHEAPLAKKLLRSTGIVSDIFISHLRLASLAFDVCYTNTHPFKRMLNSRPWVFAHNGSMNTMSWKFPNTVFQPQGTTDSENIFCYILSEIQQQMMSWNNETFSWLHSVFVDVNAKASLNLMMSDGEFLFCYCDCHDHNGGLSFVRIDSGYAAPPHFETDEKLVYGFIISTRPLTSVAVKKFDSGELRVFRKGVEVYSSSVGGRL